MRKISLVGVAAALILAGVGSWVGSTTLGGAVIGWSGVSIAEEANGPRRLGVLMRIAEDDPSAQTDVQTFQRGLEKLGWTAGRNVLIEYRWAAGSEERGQALAKELVALKPDALVAYGTPMLEATRRATRTIPIVFTMVTDPVGQGFVVTLARPGGNATGFTSFEVSIGGKWLELIKEISPRVKRAELMFNPVTAPYGTSYLHSAESAAASFGVDVTGAPIRDDADIERIITALGGAQSGSLIKSRRTSVKVSGTTIRLPLCAPPSAVIMRSMSASSRMGAPVTSTPKDAAADSAECK